MARFSDWSETPSLNTTIAGIDISENCSPANMNNMGREIMSACKFQDENKADGTLYVTKANSILSDNATAVDKGGVLHHNNTANASANVFVQAAGGTPPAMLDGDFLFEY
jgi:purine nucleoside permease